MKLSTFLRNFDLPGWAHEAQEMEKENERLRAALELRAECPCCEERVTCLDGCTFRDDAPGWGDKRYEDMMDARRTLRGENK